MGFFDYDEKKLTNTEALIKKTTIMPDYYANLDYQYYYTDNSVLEVARDVCKQEMVNIYCGTDEVGIKVTANKEGASYFEYEGKRYEVFITVDTYETDIKVTLDGEEVKEFDWKLGFAIYKAVAGLVCGCLEWGETDIM